MTRNPVPLSAASDGQLDAIMMIAANVIGAIRMGLSLRGISDDPCAVAATLDYARALTIARSDMDDETVAEIASGSGEVLLSAVALLRSEHAAAATHRKMGRA